MKIEEVIENFDFVKVHKVMESLNWTWANNKKSKNFLAIVMSNYDLFTLI